MLNLRRASQPSLSIPPFATTEQPKVRSGEFPQPGSKLRSVASAPTSPQERIEIVDVLRGFALLGILLVNMSAYSSPIFYLPATGHEAWISVCDRLSIHFITGLATGKFVTIFSFLFGLGFALQLRRSEARKASIVPSYLRRLSGLLAIGLIHAFLIWMGDILVAYALMGVLLLLFRGSRPAIILVSAALLFAMSYAKWEVALIRDFTTPAVGSAISASQMSGGGQLDADLEVKNSLRAYGHGSFAEIKRQEARDVFFNYRVTYNQFPHVLSLFLLGLYVGRRSLLANLQAHIPWFRSMWRVGLLMGFLGEATLYWLYHPHFPAWSKLLRPLAFAVGNLGLSLFYVCILILLFQQEKWKPWLRFLAPVGRLALTNYILQSVICTTIFYSYGLRLYGKVGPTAGLGLTLLIFSFQVFVSQWWVKRHRFGPLEWCLRTLTYWKIQPLRPSA